MDRKFESDVLSSFAYLVLLQADPRLIKNLLPIILVAINRESGLTPTVSLEVSIKNLRVRFLGFI